MNAFELFTRIYDAPALVRNQLMTVGLPRVIPIASGLRIRVVDVDLGEFRSATTMPFSRRSRNHVGSIYLGALLVQAETTMATLAIGLCRPPDFRVLVKRNEADFAARATGTVRAVCAPDDEERRGLERLRALRDDKAESWVTVRTDQDGTPICTVRFLLSVKHRSR